MQGWLSSWKVWIALALTALAILLTFPRRSTLSADLDYAETAIVQPGKRH